MKVGSPFWSKLGPFYEKLRSPSHVASDIGNFSHIHVWFSPTTIDNVLVQDFYMLIGSNATPELLTEEKKARWAVPKH